MKEQDTYLQAYAEGYLAASKEMEGRATKPYIDKEALIARYDGKISMDKAYEIIRAVRHVCNGGRLQSTSMVLLSELEYWESLVDKQFKARL